MVLTKVFFYIVCMDCTVSLAVSLECYSCTNVTRTQDCKTKTTCDQGEECYTSTNGIGAPGTFTLGCKRKSDCLSGLTVSLVGRSVGAQNGCSQCCTANGCNANLCALSFQVISQVDQCEDDPSSDCAAISAWLNLCSDIHHAKLKCRKYCGLCTLVDGVWATWGSWSRCDVTCGSGHMTRSRSCSDPAPADGGFDCVGNKTERTSCTLSECPVHGSWSLWSSWGYCSVTCEIGLERRERSCSNPYPGPTGDHCFGDSRDYRPCFIKACADGIWSTWSVWGSCSATCLGGLQKRSRTCDNPAPTQLGHACVGNSEVYQACNNKECQQGLPVTFRATNVSNYAGSSLRTLIYTNTEVNVGGGYDNTTGIFTAPETCNYSFTARTCIYMRQTYYFQFVKDGHVETNKYLEDWNGANNNFCKNNSVYISMAAGNKVWTTISGYDLSPSWHAWVNMFEGICVGV